MSLINLNKKANIECKNSKYEAKISSKYYVRSGDETEQDPYVYSPAQGAYDSNITYYTRSGSEGNYSYNQVNSLSESVYNEKLTIIEITSSSSSNLYSTH